LLIISFEKSVGGVLQRHIRFLFYNLTSLKKNYEHINNCCSAGALIKEVLQKQDGDGDERGWMRHKKAEHILFMNCDRDVDGTALRRAF
jgi:hypothetical protein